MNNKGFTLVELLATIVILSVIMGIATYGVMSAVNKSKAKSEKIFIDKLELAIQNYLSYYGKELYKNESGLSTTIEKCGRTTETGTCPEVNLWELNNINLTTITEVPLKTIKKEDIRNPKNKEYCLENGKNPTIRVFKDEDAVYYYYVDLSEENTSCKITTENAIITNLPSNISQNLE